MINWKLRLKNEVTLLTLSSTVIGFVYQILSLFDIVPAVSEEQVIQLLALLINFLAMLGIIADPTTAGFGDTKLAMGYSSPRKEGDDING